MLREAEAEASYIIVIHDNQLVKKIVIICRSPLIAVGYIDGPDKFQPFVLTYISI